jgi:hypothetical protein
MFASYPPLTVLRRSNANYATLGKGRLVACPHCGNRQARYFLNEFYLNEFHLNEFHRRAL